MTTKIKICGLKTRPALDAALAGGADFVGFVFYPPSPRNVAPAIARDLVQAARGRARSVALLVDPDDALLDQIVTDVDPDLIQLHGHESAERVSEIVTRSARPIIKAVAVQTIAEVDAALAYRDIAELILFDAKAPASLRGALPGGNGLAFDWHLLGGMSGKLDFMLSGGLTPANVCEAIRLTRPFAVDVSSGVEMAPGEKSPELIRQFLTAAKSASVSA
ncbi:MAG: phosphoribosylanthranilate isomerase [Hyphomicrobiaceae bacterium]|jgi:phosphoribosylanthranilate isomerase